MKYKFLIVLGFLIVSSIVQAHPPKAQRVLEIFFQHIDVALTKEQEPLCAMNSFNGKNVTLKDHFALVLSSAFVKNTITTLKAHCEASKQEVGEELIDSWDCDLFIKESDQDGQYIASSSIRFALAQDGLTWLPGSLRCF